MYSETERPAEGQPDLRDRKEKNHELFLRQKELLDTFLQNGAISKAQYDKSFGDLREKMGE